MIGNHLKYSLVETELGGKWPSLINFPLKWFVVCPSFIQMIKEIETLKEGVGEEPDLLAGFGTEGNKRLVISY